jgi:hypothetical protein
MVVMLQFNAIGYLLVFLIVTEPLYELFIKGTVNSIGKARGMQKATIDRKLYNRR